MSRKTSDAYEAAFDFINLKIFNMEGTKLFVTDYELALRNALRKKYPGSKLSSCHFHFAQAIRRKGTQIHGFIDFLRSNDAAKKIYYKLMYLPLLPPESLYELNSRLFINSWLRIEAQNQMKLPFF